MPKRLLVIDPIPTHRIRLKAALRAAQYDIVSIDRIACATGAMAAGPVDLIILNTSGADPAQMMTRLRKAIGQPELPVLCRDDSTGPERRVQALSTGARDMVSTRVPDALLLARIRGLLRENDTSAELERRRIAATSFGFREAPVPFEPLGQIAVVNLGFAKVPGSDGQGVRSHRLQPMSREDLMRDDGIGAGPDANLLNVGYDACDTLDEVLPEIRMRSHLRQASVLVLHPKDRHDIAVRALNLGAAENAEEGSSDEELTYRIDAILSRKRMRDALRRSNEESYRLAATDSLTGLYNRRYADVYLEDVFSRSGGSECGFTVMLIDIDRFKAVNDRFGHAAGDMVLREVAARIRDNLRAVDLVSRHGGEEFLVVLPDIERAEAALAADRIRATIGGQPVSLSDGTDINVTISIGVAVASETWAASTRSGPFGAEPSTSGVIEELLSQADQALYRAKSAGRNCVSVSSAVASAA